MLRRGLSIAYVSGGTEHVVVEQGRLDCREESRCWTPRPVLSPTSLPRLWVFAGLNGAGKTTLFSQTLCGGLPFVNADEIARDMPRSNGRLDELAAGREAVRRREALIADRLDLAIETTLSGASGLRFMSRAKDAGYRVLLAYVGLVSVELSAARVASRVAEGGHDVPQDVIVRRYPDSLRRTPRAMAIADRWWVFDNSGRERVLLATSRTR